jgi:hypothetical protein
MACCAFAIYLVSMLIWPLRRLLRFGKPPRWKADAAVEWKPGQPMPVQRARGRLTRAAVALGLGGVLAASAATAISTPASDADTTRQTPMTKMCSSFGGTKP